MSTERTSYGDTVCRYHYTYKPGTLASKYEGWWHGGGGEGLLLRALAEPVMMGVSVAEKQKHRLPGEVTVAYDRAGTMVWWVGTRSSPTTSPPKRERDP